MTIVLETMGDVPPALASFYALGERRNGWLMHLAWPGQVEKDRQRLTEAGLDVERLEAEGRMEINEMRLSDPPETWAEPWIPVAKRQLEAGFDAVWWSRFPVGPDEAVWPQAIAYDKTWDAAFAESNAVSMCVYVVGGLARAQIDQRVSELRAVHDETLVLQPDGDVDVLPRVDS
jgi:hypothetical protein